MKKHLFFNQWKIHLALLLCLPVLLIGCSDDEKTADLSGNWTGRILNPSAKTGWEFHMYFSRNGDELFGIFTDYRGSFTAQNISYNGSELSFIIDIHPHTVSFYGVLETDTYINGSWSYSGDDNNGLWYIQKDDSKYDPDEEEDNDDSESNSSNPFKR